MEQRTKIAEHRQHALGRHHHSRLEAAKHSYVARSAIDLLTVRRKRG
jgi:hypothetical protein